MVTYEAGVAAPRLSASSLALRLARGWDPYDPLLHLAWHPVVVDAVAAMGHRRDLERLRPELEHWVQRCGIEQPWHATRHPWPARTPANWSSGRRR